ncbi:hypothetical protein DL769_003980 [Monosporascus sp. CRB-8-3]|nr:hypothetical protein DL769_003980 [Monosporascus sp. CRB-8-3]
MRFTGLASCLVIVAGLASAHPGHDISQEIVERREFLSAVKRNDLSHCAEKLKARGVLERNVARRSAAVEKARAERGLKKRDLDDVLNTSHNKTELGYTPATDPALLFEGYNSCLLAPEGVQGPYYVGGEYIRRNITDGQEGVDMVLDYQVIDVDTCDPIPNAYLEIWHCNATGVYSGVIATGNGDTSDETNIDKTFLRGIQKTNEDGVAQFESIFPGHYTGRTIHIHVMVHTNVTRYSNGTLGNDVSASHVGQAYFDQALVSEVELQAPYNENQQELTLNVDDGILAQDAATDGVDPLMEYTLLGDSVSDGLFAWLAFGINATRVQPITPAVFYYEEGGVANPDAGRGGGGPPSGMPSGNPTDAPAGSATAA